VVAPGIVVTSDPMYYIYADALQRKGFEVLAVPEDGEGIGLEALERKLRALGGAVERIAFFYAVTVNNPSCTILSNRRRRALLEVAARLSREQGRWIPIFYDLAYELLLHDPRAEPFVSVLPEDDLGIAYEIGTLSKVLAPGLRIGYLLGPDGPLMNAMVQKTSDAGFRRAALRSGNGQLSARPAHHGTTARGERGLSREGGGGKGWHRAQPGTIYRRMPRRQRRLLLLPDVAGCRDPPHLGLLPVSDAHHG